MAQYTFLLLPECLHYSPALSRRINDPASLQTLMRNSWCSRMASNRPPSKPSFLFHLPAFSWEEVMNHWRDCTRQIEVGCDGGTNRDAIHIPWPQCLPLCPTKQLKPFDRLTNQLNQHPLQCKKKTSIKKWTNKYSQLMYFHFADLASAYST